jgi:hypothetical protein
MMPALGIEAMFALEIQREFLRRQQCFFCAVTIPDEVLEAAAQKVADSINAALGNRPVVPVVAKELILSLRSGALEHLRSIEELRRAVSNMPH